ncbi:MAG: replication initiation protein RepC [Rhizobiales bacterium PAR1]|nr:MAG: replication initiation protein RepC [Rhizobiales bacterium PAR1]
MTHGLATTPFGRRSMSLGLIATQAQARAVEPEKTVHKWKVFTALTEAKDRLGLPDRALAILNALLSFHQETTLTAGDPLVVFPSNEKLAARAHGVAPTTLRRHLAILVDAGIVIRRDSPNGKRYARRGEGGAVSEAFGFDLTPLVARAEEFEALAAEVQARKKALRLARERVTLARRDITKMIALGLEEALPGDWMGLHAAYLGIIAGLRRSADVAALTTTAADLTDLACAIANHLELFVNSSIPDANESQNGAHKQNSKTDLHESEPASKNDRGEIDALQPEQSEHAISELDDPLTAPAEAHPAMGTPLGMVLEACPDILDYAEAPTGEGQLETPTIRNWAAFLKTAALVRAMLGISPDAWQDAVETMGLVDASIVIAAILQKGDDIRFPGGYLRALTEKKREGHFSVGPILMALISARLKEARGQKRETFRSD